MYCSVKDNLRPNQVFSKSWEVTKKFLSPLKDEDAGSVGMIGIRGMLETCQ